MIINGKEIKPYESVFVIAETASSHEGNMDIAKRLADAVSAAGADAIKYQMFSADSLLVPSHHKYGSFSQIQFSEDAWREIVAYARSRGLFVIAEVFDSSSLELAVSLNISVIKVPTSDLVNPFLLRQASAAAGTLILSVGAATEEEIAYAVQEVSASGKQDIIVMHGFQSFPTKIEDTNFRLLNFLKQKYPYPVGFADHIDADSELALYYPLIGIGFGASVIEKHITLNRSLKGRDYYSALNPGEFAYLVGLVRIVEKSYGKRDFGSTGAEIAYRNLMKKRIIALRDIAEGERIALADIGFRRTDEPAGLMPCEYEKALGRAARAIPANAQITGEDVC